jgi:hypothetical protein
MVGKSTKTLNEYLRELTDGAPATRPTRREKWAGMLKRIDAFGQIAEVDKETYWHFLEVLPLRWMDDKTFAFCFAEGMESFRLFWHQRERYFCRRLTWAETYRFCDLASLRRDYFFY